MNILTIPGRCARRKMLRSAVLLLVFTLGVTSIVALAHVSRVVGDSLERKLTAFGANILLTPKRETLAVSYGGVNLGNVMLAQNYLDVETVLGGVRGIGHAQRISGVAPKLLAVEEKDGVNLGVVGVDWRQELAMKSYWAVQGAFPSAPGELLAGEAAARRLGLKPGDSIQLLGREFPVRGVLLPTGGDDDKVLFTDLETLQGLNNAAGKVSFVEVSALCAGCPIEEITDQLTAALPGVEVMALRNVVEQRMYSIHFVQHLVLAVSVVILLTGSCMVGLSMLSAVNERRREIGILRSLGYSKPQVFGVFCVEALLLGLVAGVLGYVLGWAASFRVLHALDVAEAGGVAFEPLYLAVTCFLVALVTLLAAAFPAWKASRVHPTEALVAL